MSVADAEKVQAALETLVAQVNATNRQIEEKLAEVRGESVAAHMIAVHCLLILARNVANPNAALAELAANLENAVNAMRIHAPDERGRETGVVTREVARRSIDEAMAEVTRLLG